MSTYRDELDALLVKQATQGLDPEEARRLNQILAEHPEADAEWADRLVGELDAETSASQEQPLSQALRADLMATAPEGVVGAAAPTGAGGRPVTSWLGWAVAAALGFLWFGGLGGGPDGVPATFQTLASAGDAVLAEWAPGPDVTGTNVSGEVVWSSLSQEGVMRLAGLAVNAPDEFQYQLWIFDAERDERYPVDGGVFDMPPGGGPAEVAVRAKLNVSEPTLFAVTVEEPGGVVVSSRERIATIAQISD